MELLSQRLWYIGHQKKAEKGHTKNTKNSMAQDSEGRATTTSSTLEHNREERERPIRISERVSLLPFALSVN